MRLRFISKIIISVILIFAPNAYAGDHAVIGGRATDQSCKTSLFANPFLYYYFSQLQPEPYLDPTLSQQERALRLAPFSSARETGNAHRLHDSAHRRADTFLLQTYARALKCNPEDALAKSWAQFASSLDPNDKRFEVSPRFSSPDLDDRRALSELLRSLRLAADTLGASVETRATIASLVAKRVSGSGPALTGPLAGTALSSIQLGSLTGDGRVKAIVDGHADPAQLFNKTVLGLNAAAARELEAKLVKAVPCNATEADLLKKLDETGANRVSLLFAWQADYLQNCKSVDSLGRAIAALTRAEQARGHGARERAQLAALAEHHALVPALFDPNKPDSDARISLGSQIRAQARAIALGEPVDAFTQPFEAYLGRLGASGNAKNALLPHLRDDEKLANGAANPRQFYASLLGANHGDLFHLSQQKLGKLGAAPADGLRPLERLFARPERAKDANFHGPDTTGWPRYWAPRPNYFQITGKDHTEYFNSALDYIAAAAYHSGGIDTTQIDFSRLTGDERRVLRAALLGLYASVSADDPADLLRRYDPTTPAYKFKEAKPRQLKAIANLLQWLDTPDRGVSPLTADEERKSYEDHIRVEAKRAADRNPYLTGEQEIHIADVVSGLPSPLRARLAALPDSERSALLDLAERARKIPAQLPFAREALLTGGGAVLKTYLAKLDADSVAHAGDAATVARRAVVMALTVPALPAGDLAFRSETKPPFQCPAPAGAGRNGGVFSDAEVAFMNNAERMSPEELSGWIMQSDAVALQSFRCRLASAAHTSPNHLVGTWPRARYVVVGLLDKNELAISRRRQTGPGGVAAFNAEQLEHRTDQIGARYLELRKLKRASAMSSGPVRLSFEAEEKVLIEELAQIAKAQGRENLLPARPASALDFVNALQYDPKRFETWLKGLDEQARHDLGQELTDLYAGGYRTEMDLKIGGGRSDYDDFRPHADRAIELVKASFAVPPAKFAHGDTDEARHRYLAERRTNIDNACKPGPGDVLKRFFAARAALSDRNEAAARNEFRRKVRARGEPDFGERDNFLAGHIGSRRTLVPSQWDELVNDLATMPTYELERLSAAMNRQVGLDSYARNDGLAAILGYEYVELDVTTREQLKAVIARYLRARLAGPSFEKLAAAEVSNIHGLLETEFPGAGELAADYLFVLSRDARALEAAGCPKGLADRFDRLRIATLAHAARLDAAGRVFAQGLFTADGSAVRDAINKQMENDPQKFMEFLQTIENTRGALATHGLGPADAQVGRVEGIIAEHLKSVFSGQFAKLRDAIRSQDWAHLADLRDEYRRARTLELAASAANYPVVREMLATYAPEIGLMASLLKDGTEAIPYDLAPGKRIFFLPNMVEIDQEQERKRDKRKITVQTADEFKSSVEAAEKRFTDSLIGYQGWSQKAGTQNYFSLLKEAYGAIGKPQLFTKAQKIKEAAYDDVMEALWQFRRLGMKTSSTKQALDQVAKVNDIDSLIIESQKKNFYYQSAALALAPLAWYLGPAFGPVAAEYSYAAQIAVTTFGGALMGGVHSTFSQFAEIADANTNGKPAPQFSLKRIGQSTLQGGLTGGFVGLLGPISPAAQSLLVGGGSAYGLTSGAATAALKYEEGKLLTGTLEAAFAVSPYVFAPRAKSEEAKRPAEAGGAPPPARLPPAAKKSDGHGATPVRGRDEVVPADPNRAAELIVGQANKVLDRPVAKVLGAALEHNPRNPARQQAKIAAQEELDHVSADALKKLSQDLETEASLLRAGIDSLMKRPQDDATKAALARLSEAYFAVQAAQGQVRNVVNIRLLAELSRIKGPDGKPIIKIEGEMTGKQFNDAWVKAGNEPTFLDNSVVTKVTINVTQDELLTMLGNRLITLDQYRALKTVRSGTDREGGGAGQFLAPEAELYTRGQVTQEVSATPLANNGKYFFHVDVGKGRTLFFGPIGPQKSAAEFANPAARAALGEANQMLGPGGKIQMVDLRQPEKVFPGSAPAPTTNRVVIRTVTGLKHSRGSAHDDATVGALTRAQEAIRDLRHEMATKGVAFPRYELVYKQPNKPVPGPVGPRLSPAQRAAAKREFEAQVVEMRKRIAEVEKLEHRAGTGKDRQDFLDDIQILRTELAELEVQLASFR